MPLDWLRLLEFAPLALAKPGSPEAAALMQGYLQSKQRIEQERRLNTQATGQEELRKAQIANLSRDDTRADELLALQRIKAAMDAGQGAVAGLRESPETMLPAGTDPLQAQNALVMDQDRAQHALGVPAGTPQTPLPNMTALVSEGKRRRASKWIEAFDKAHAGQGADAAESYGPIMFGEFQGMAPAQIRALVTSVPMGPGRAGREGASDLDRSFQRAKRAKETELGRPLTPAEDDALDTSIRREVGAINRTSPDPAVASLAKETAELRRDLLQRQLDEPPAEPNQGQFVAAGYAGRLEQAENTFKAIEKSIAQMNWASFKAQEASPAAILQSGPMQSYMQASRNFINAVLRRESGAVISPSEFAEARLQYLPQPGDRPETLTQKTRNREYVFATMKRQSGRAYQPPIVPPGKATGGSSKQGITILSIEEVK